MDDSKNEHANRFKTCVAALRAKACDRVDPATGEVLIKAKGEFQCLLLVHCSTFKQLNVLPFACFGSCDHHRPCHHHGTPLLPPSPPPPPPPPPPLPPPPP